MISTSQEEVATVAEPAGHCQCASLLQLPTEIQRHIIEGRLSAGHGRVLVLDAERNELAQRTIDEGLSVRRSSAWPRRAPEAEPRRRRPTEAVHRARRCDSDAADVGRPSHSLLELEELLATASTPRLALRLKRGKITIDFDIDDLERIYG